MTVQVSDAVVDSVMNQKAGHLGVTFGFSIFADGMTINMLAQDLLVSFGVNIFFVSITIN